MSKRCSTGSLPRAPRETALIASLLLLSMNAAAGGCPVEPRQVTYQGTCLDAEALTAAFVCPEGTDLVVDDSVLFWTRQCNDSTGRTRVEHLWIVTKDSLGYPGRIVERDPTGGGTYTHFHPNSDTAQHILTEANFEHHGIARVFYADGSLAEEGPWAAGQLHGIWNTYDEHGKHVEESCTVFGQRAWSHRDIATFGQRACTTGEVATAIASYPRPDLIWAQEPTNHGATSHLIATPEGVVIARDTEAHDHRPGLLLPTAPHRIDLGPDGPTRLGKVVLLGRTVLAEWKNQKTLSVLVQPTTPSSDTTKPPSNTAASPAAAWRTVATGIDRAELLLSDGTQIWCIAYDDDDDAYVQRIYRIPWSGGKEVLATAAGLVAGTAADAEFLYWGDDDGIKRVSKSGGEVSVLTPTIDYLSELVVDGEWLYFSTGGHQNTRGQVGDGGIYKVPRAGGTPELMASWGDIADDLLVDDGWLYWGVF